MKADSWVGDLVGLLLPAGCAACGSWMPSAHGDSLVCGRCRSRLREAPWPRCARCHHPSGTGRPAPERCRECAGWPEELTAARYAYVLEPPASELVHALKYGGWRELGDEMGAALARLPIPTDATGCEPLVVPVPTTRGRKKRRGYNQAALLARGLARRAGWSVLEALQRTREGPTQVALHPSQRKANVKDVFTARRGVSSRVRDARVVLVDDVLTTGSTAGAAAAALIRMGARTVTLVTFARALPFRQHRVD